MTSAEFSARFQAAAKSLWLIAAAVLGRRDDAEDLVQESAVIGLQKINEFRPETNFAAWMGGIVRNLARNHARKGARRHTGATDPADLDHSRAGRPTAEQPPQFGRDGKLSPSQSAFDDHVLHALDVLEETPRLCLLLRSLHQLPYRDIAALLSIPEGTAMSHVHRARATMREYLISRASESTGGPVG
jgi:RNA polymerase sigma-70 factor (ECF subfamily)